MKLFTCKSDTIEVVVYLGKFEQITSCDDLLEGRQKYQELCLEMRDIHQISKVALKVNGKTLEKTER